MLWIHRGETEITSVPGVTLKLDLCKREIRSNKKVNKSKDRSYELLQAYEQTESSCFSLRRDARVTRWSSASMKRHGRFFTTWAGLRLTNMQWGWLQPIFSPRTGKGQRAQSMDSDHSGSLPFVKKKRYLRATQVILEVKLATQGVQRVRRAAVMLGRNCFRSFQTALTALRSTSYSSTDRKQQLFFPSPCDASVYQTLHLKKKKKGFPCIILYKALELPHTLPALRLIWFHFFCHIKHNFLRNESPTVYVPCELRKFLVFTPPNSTPPRGKNIK